jgi:uncharacterized protein DUF4349
MRARQALWVLCLVCVAASGCMGAYEMADGGAPMRTPSAENADRMLIWRAWVTVSVADVAKASAEAKKITAKYGGYVQEQSGGDEREASLTLRIPIKSFKDGIAALETLGEVTSRTVSSEDVTEQYIDTAARLKNKIALRDRLKKLLDKAQKVQEVLAIERELTRVQSDIDSMQGRLKALRGQIDLATVDLSIERRTIPGPLGYVFKGIGWTIKKLFVWQD